MVSDSDLSVCVARLLQSYQNKPYQKLWMCVCHIFIVLYIYIYIYIYIHTHTYIHAYIHTLYRNVAYTCSTFILTGLCVKYRYRLTHTHTHTLSFSLCLSLSLYIYDVVP